MDKEVASDNAPVHRDGGSARSQASDLELRTWQARPWVARAIRTARAALTLLVAVLAIRMVATLVPQPEAPALLIGWLAMLVALSLSIVQLMDRGTRRLLPLAMLYQMSLVFPDRAPQRFSTALRQGPAGSGRGGSQSPDAGADLVMSPTVQQHAEHVLALLSGLTGHDRRTRGHTERVRAYSQMIGTEIGLPREEVDLLAWGAMLHDIGKLHVPPEVLSKAGAPTAAEWAELRRHPECAEPYIEPLRDWLGQWADAATQHHERFDGTGYPHGLVGTEISLSGRIVAIADAYDVMTSVRSYKRALPPAVARAELSRNAGSQFDRQLVRAFLGVSVGRSRLMLGPLGWFSQLPEVLHIPLASAMSSVASGAVATVAVATMSLVSVLPGVLDARSDSTPGNQAADVETVATSEGTGTEPADSADGPDGPRGIDPRELTRRDPPPASEPGPNSDPGPATTTLATTPEGPVPLTTAAAPDPGRETVDPGDPLGTTTVPDPQTTVPDPEPTTPTATTTPATTVLTSTPATGFAADDTATAIAFGPVVVIPVLDNDDFSSSAPVNTTLVIVTYPSLGLAWVNGNKIRYFAGPVPGADAFTYRICNEAGACAEAAVSVTVTA